MKRHLLIGLSFFFCLAAGNKTFSQTDISMATHWYNRGNYNPASIARTDYIYLFSNVRSQWTGITGAPRVANVQVSGYFNSINSAFGLSAVNDQIGITNALNPMLNYAYRLSNDQSWSLAFGVGLGAFIRTIDISSYSPVNDLDPALMHDVAPQTKPDANIGVEFQNASFIFGLSSTHLFSVFKDSTLFLNANHRYGYAIYKNTRSEMLNYYLGVQVVNRSNIFVVEGNGTVRFKHPTGLSTGSREIFDLGLTYRSTRQLTALFGVNLTENFRVGYAYDQSFITGYNQNGSHEIMLEYRIPFQNAVCKTCRDQQLWYR